MPVIRERRPPFLQNDDRQQLRLARIGIARKQQKRRSARPDTILKQSPSVLNLSGNRSHASSSFILNSSRLSHSISTTQKQPGSFSKPSSVYDRIANGFRKPGNEIVGSRPERCQTRDLPSTETARRISDWLLSRPDPSIMKISSSLWAFADTKASNSVAGNNSFLISFIISGDRRLRKDSIAPCATSADCRPDRSLRTAKRACSRAQPRETD